jgi:peroxiredoxin
MGAGGLIIIKDPVESALPLPRTYGVDDLPLVFTSRRFYTNNEFNYAGNNVKYGDYALANGTLDAQVAMPAQVVRLRILNAEIERGYIIGFKDNRTFHLIATDGGLVDKPVPLTRIKLMVGERAELLVDLSSDKPGSSIDLMAFNANQPFGFPGGEPQRGGPNGSLLNNIDFRLLNIRVTAPTDKPIMTIPQTLTHNHFWTDADVTSQRSIKVNGTPPNDFYFDDEPFDMHSTDQVQIVKLGSVESWTIRNNNVFGHSFHIHDVQFKIVARSGGPVADYEQGWKDTVYVPRAKTVTFVAKFEDFSSDTEPYMYHCHMSNHEDAGLMGNFLVVKDPSTIKLENLAFRSRIDHPVTPEMIAAADRAAQTPAPDFQAADLSGKSLDLKSLTAKKPLILFFIESECPCSRDAAVYLDRLQTTYAGACTVVGVIDAAPEVARAWTKQSAIHFPIITDTDLKIIYAYGVKQSVCTTVIAPGGMIDKTYPGYSEDMLTDLSARVAKLGGVPVGTFLAKGAPKQLLSGCVFSKK